MERKRSWSRCNIRDFLEKNYPLISKAAESKGFVGGQILFCYDRREVPSRQYKFVHALRPIDYKCKYEDGTRPIAVAHGERLCGVLKDLLNTLDIEIPPELDGLVVNERFKTTFRNQ
jgi:hypothetical protein